MKTTEILNIHLLLRLSHRYFDEQTPLDVRGEAFQNYLEEHVDPHDIRVNKSEHEDAVETLAENLGTECKKGIGKTGLKLHSQAAVSGEGD